MPTLTSTEREQATVVRVIDGDTIEIEGGARVRYIGMDTPESTIEHECFGSESSRRNGELVSGKTVELEKDVSETDRYGRLLRYIWLDGELINEVLVREGYAVSSTYPPDVKYQDRFLAAEREAREANAGLWGACGGADQPLVPTQPPLTNRRDCDAIRGTNYLSPEEREWFLANCIAHEQPSGCEPSYPDVCIPPPPPDLDCPQVPYTDFRVYPPDPHGFDGNDNDGRGCENGGGQSVPPPPPPAQSCHPSYVGACLDPNASDYDCAGGSGNGPYYTGPVQVVGPDVFDLDRDNDGYGCE